MCLNLVCANFMTYNKAIAFIVPQLLPFLLKVRQEPRDQSDKGHIATYVINRLYAIPISHIPQHSRCNPRYPKGKTEKKTGDQTYLYGNNSCAYTRIAGKADDKVKPTQKLRIVVRYRFST